MTGLRGAARFATTSVAVSLLTACHDPASPSDLDRLGARISTWTPDSAATVLRSPYSGFASRMHLVVADSVTWRGLWAQALIGVIPVRPAPAIDFTTYSVVGITAGGFPQSFSISLDSLVTHQYGIVAYSMQEVPGESCGTPAIATSPVVLVRAPGKPAILLWIDRRYVYQCD